MKVLVLNGSPKRESSDTMHITRAFLKGMASTAPLDAETLAEYAAKCGCVVTAENHNITGGLGAAVAASLARTRPVPVEMVGVNDEFGEVGTEDFLRKRFDLTADHIIRAAKAAIARK